MIRPDVAFLVVIGGPLTLIVWATAIKVAMLIIGAEWSMEHQRHAPRAPGEKSC